MRRLKPFYIYLTLIVAFSLASYIFYYTSNELNLANADSRTRLNIALRVTQNLTPGLAQLGGVWLPFPQLLESPLVLIKELYRTGAAGYIVSGTSFIIASLFIYKLIYLYTKNNLSSFIGGMIFATSINMLYLQTTALSEPFFIMSIVGTTYFLCIWVFKRSYAYLPIAGFFVMLATLTRYEGYAVFAASIATVSIITLLQYRPKIRYLESNLILFTTVAALGIFIWFLYNWLIFGHPLQSFTIYSGRASVLSTESLGPSVVAGGSRIRSLSHAFEGVFTITAEMIGIFVVIVGTIGFLYVYVKSLWSLKRDASRVVQLLPLLILLAPLTFLLFTFYFGGPNAIYPKLTVTNLFSNQFNFTDELNIRYGIQSLPFFVVFAALFIGRNRLIAFFVSVLTIAQLALFFYPVVNAAYYLPIRAAHAYPPEKAKIEKTADWLRQNYTGGLVLVSVYESDPRIFYFPVPYKNYIFEGTGKYWKQSLKKPQKYASWVLITNAPKPKSLGTSNADVVSYYLKDEEVLDNNFDLVYTDELFLIYKNKTKPEVQIDN